jgi:hypothetical protein
MATFPQQMYRAAACKRGHYWSQNLEAEDESVPNYCPRCGARIVAACEVCGVPVLGSARGGVPRRKPHPFCFDCGAPCPWATREERVAQLYNLLDSEESVSVADRLEVIEAIDMMAKPDEDFEGGGVAERARAARKIAKLAPGVWRAVVPVLQTLLGAALKQELGIE